MANLAHLEKLSLTNHATVVRLRDRLSVGWQDWQDRRKELLVWRDAHPRRSLQLRAPIDISLRTLSTDVENFSTISIQVVSFTDGLIFSMGHSLRRRYRYDGVLIAVGDILPQQLSLFQRCGFDRVELDLEFDPTAAPYAVLQGFQPHHVIQA